MWIVISILVFFEVVFLGAFVLMAILPEEPENDITETRHPPFYNPYDSHFM